MAWLALKILGPIAILAGLWLWHGSEVDDAFEAGQEEVTTRWQESDRLAKAIGDETTKLLKRGAAQNATELQYKLDVADKRASLLAADRNRMRGDVDSLRNELERRAAAPPSSDPAHAACRGDEAKLRSCESVVLGSIALAQSARGLADSAQALLERSNIALEALQAWSVLVQSANEAP